MNKPLMIAHRGYSHFERENTLVAFTAAGTIDKFYGIETDVHITSDNHFITVHDDNLFRVSNEKIDLNVEKNPYNLIKEVKLPDLDGSTTRNDLIVPEMIDYFKICKKYNKVAVCELKQVFNKTQIQEIIEIVKSIDMLDNTIFISFILEDLILIREISNNIKAQWLLCDFKEEYIETLKKYNLDLDVHYPKIDKETIKLCHDNNIKVNIWTVNDQEIANKYASWGGDFITSNWVKETF